MQNQIELERSDVEPDVRSSRTQSDIASDWINDVGSIRLDLTPFDVRSSPTQTQGVRPRTPPRSIVARQPQNLLRLGAIKLKSNRRRQACRTPLFRRSSESSSSSRGRHRSFRGTLGCVILEAALDPDVRRYAGYWEGAARRRRTSCKIHGKIRGKINRRDRSRTLRGSRDGSRSLIPICRGNAPVEIDAARSGSPRVATRM